MQRDEAKAILELCRPGSTEDAKDPLIADALALLETDVELKAWFDEQQTLDARISEAYNRIEPPADLKASILVGMRAHALKSKRESEGVPRDVARIIPGKHDKMDAPKTFRTTSQTWWRNPWMGIAAVFALLFFLTLSTRTKREHSSQLASNANVQQAGIPPMIDFLSREIEKAMASTAPYAMQSDRLDELRAYLASHNVPSPAKLPSPMQNKPTYGCFTFDYNGHKMGMICFKVDEEVTHLTTAPKTDCMDHIGKEPLIYEIRGQAFKVWVEGEQVQILSIQGGKEKLPEFI